MRQHAGVVRESRLERCARLRLARHGDALARDHFVRILGRKRSRHGLKIYKKATGKPTVTFHEALDVALCWGWIDGLRKGHDADSFVQRFTPRRAQGIWSQVNQGHVARLRKAGRMTPHGERHVAAAEADGRWVAADALIREASQGSVPADLRASRRTAGRAARGRMSRARCG
jgi:uncharacterized protein YdeI (YjbR/CyaY-like superfamily)